MRQIPKSSLIFIYINMSDFKSKIESVMNTKQIKHSDQQMVCVPNVFVYKYKNKDKNKRYTKTARQFKTNYKLFLWKSTSEKYVITTQEIVRDRDHEYTLLYHGAVWLLACNRENHTGMSVLCIQQDFGILKDENIHVCYACRHMHDMIIIDNLLALHKTT